MTRKVLCIFLTLMFLASFGATGASAKPIAPKCSKIGSTKSVKGYKYTCVNSGRTKVWGKPKKIVKKSTKRQVSIVPFNPVPRTVVANSSPSSNSGNQEITPVITFDNLDSTWTSKISRNELVTEFNKLSVPTDVVEIHSGPTVVSSDLSEEQRLLRIATRMFSGYFLPANYKVVYFSQNDGAWAENVQSTLGGTFPVSISTEISRWPDGCNFAFATTGFGSIPMYYQCMDTRGRSIFDKQTAIHEYFHLVQQNYSINKMPCWMKEGSAIYFGAFLGIYDSDTTGGSTKNFIKGQTFHYNPGGTYQNPPNTRLIDKIQNNEGVVEVLTALESPTAECLSLGAYSVGATATDALIAAKGFTKYMEFVSTFNTSSNWKTDFATTYGLSPEAFYIKLAPYLRQRLS